MNFFLSRTQECLRVICLSLKNDIRTSILSAIRSQIEINAFVFYLINNHEYAKAVLDKKEDREKDKGHPELMVNALTTVNRISKNWPNYKEDYDTVSKLMHPNPSAIILTGNLRKGDGQYSRSKIDKYFVNTWCLDAEGKNEKLNWTGMYLGYIGHFFDLFDSLPDPKKIYTDRDKEMLATFNFIATINERLRSDEVLREKLAKGGVDEAEVFEQWLKEQEKKIREQYETAKGRE